MDATNPAIANRQASVLLSFALNISSSTVVQVTPVSGLPPTNEAPRKMDLNGSELFFSPSPL